MYGLSQTTRLECICSNRNHNPGNACHRMLLMVLGESEEEAENHPVGQ